MNPIERHTLSYLARRHDGKCHGYDSEQLLHALESRVEAKPPVDEFTDVLASLVARGFINRTIRWRYYITQAGEAYLENSTGLNKQKAVA